jgi:KipI family sensor histidine kinase inhibitor
MYPQFKPLGDQAILIAYKNKIDPDIVRKVRALGYKLESINLPWIIEVVPAFRCLGVFYLPEKIDYEDAVETIKDIEKGIDFNYEPIGKLYEIPTVYGGEFGPELNRVSNIVGLVHEEVVEIFSSTQFVIHFLGFLGAQPYLGGLPSKLQVPRLENPKLKVPEGSIGIGGVQAGLITIDQPSGFNFIGRTFLSLYQPNDIPPSVFKPGDKLLFKRTSFEEARIFHGIKPLPIKQKI